MYKVVNNLIRLMKNKNHPNIILYNIFDNKLIVKILNNIYNISKNKIIIHKDISYIKNNIYYDFDMNQIKYKNKDEWINIINNIIETHDYFTNKRKIIILKNFKNINLTIQNKLKVIIEKNNHIVFILICPYTNNILDSIKSRFIMIRVPNNNYYSKYRLIQNVDINNFIKYKTYSIDYIKYQNILNTNSIFINDIIQWIFKLFTKNEYNIIKNIKEFSYYYISINIIDNIFIRELLIYLLEDYTIINKKKTELVYFISEHEHIFLKSYYKMIHIEKLLIGIYKIIKT